MDACLTLLTRTPMTRICIAPFYAEVPWRGRAGAELCEVFFNPFNRWERAETGLTVIHPGSGSRKDIEAGAADRQRVWCSGRDVFARAQRSKKCEFCLEDCTLAVVSLG